MSFANVGGAEDHDGDVGPLGLAFEVLAEVKGVGMGAVGEGVVGDEDSVGNGRCQHPHRFFMGSDHFGDILER